MPFDDPGCTRATLIHTASHLHRPVGQCKRRNLCRGWNHILELLIASEEFLICVNYNIALVASLPFVHTARRSYRLSDPVNNLDCSNVWIPNIAAESLVNLIT